MLHHGTIVVHMPLMSHCPRFLGSGRRAETDWQTAASVTDGLLCSLFRWLVPLLYAAQAAARVLLLGYV